MRGAPRDLYTGSTCSRSRCPRCGERTEDIPVLPRPFSDRLVAARGGRCRRSRRRPWRCSRLPVSRQFPGARERVERAVALAEDGRPIWPQHPPSHAADRGMSRPSTLAGAIEQLKLRMIEDALRDCGTKTRAPSASAQPAELPANAEAPPALVLPYSRTGSRAWRAGGAAGAGGRVLRPPPTSYRSPGEAFPLLVPLCRRRAGRKGSEDPSPQPPPRHPPGHPLAPSRIVRVRSLSE